MQDQAKLKTEIVTNRISITLPNERINYYSNDGENTAEPQEDGEKRKRRGCLIFLWSICRCIPKKRNGQVIDIAAKYKIQGSEISN